MRKPEVTPPRIDTDAQIARLLRSLLPQRPVAPVAPAPPEFGAQGSRAK